ncbi:MAG: LytTR family transcriptional regulator DNA-binding domain-containing protein [Bacteroidales bacterium]|nr:LytTR family transcriptional regulator DNA-binding domain-containing protein [Bacteroidales bacterium]
MEKIRTLIIEDEKPARDLVKNYLQNFDFIELVGEFADGFSGIKGINELKPDLVFLDVQMPKLNGFEMLELLDELPFIVFTTAFDQYAIKAFEVNAIDYLLKPFSKDRMAEAIEKVKEKLAGKQTDTSKIKKMAEDFHEGELERIVVKTRNKILVVPIENIKYFESQDDYVMIYAEEGKFLKQKTMKFFENNLNPNKFIRIHRSYIANVDYIDQLERYEKDSYLIILKDGSKLKVSKSGLQTLKSKLEF